MNKRTPVAAMLAVILISGCGTSATHKRKAPEVTGEVELTVLRAGQADAMVLQTENHCVIIDCGEKDDGGKITEFLERNGISAVDYIFITHFDKDHIGGFPEVAESVAVGNIVVPNYEGSNSEYKKYLKSVNENDLTVTVLEEDTAFEVDDVLFEVSAPKKQDYAEGDNDFSIVISVTHGENSFLLAGDAEEERLSEVISEFTGEYDFLKVPHHGRYNRKTTAFINSVKPSYCVITDSEKNPAETETVTALEKVGCKIYSTKNGDVHITSNGENIKITQN